MYLSAARFEKVMNTEKMIVWGHEGLDNHRPLSLPLLMVTGRGDNSHIIPSPFPEVLTTAWEETSGVDYRATYEKRKMIEHSVPKFVGEGEEERKVAAAQRMKNEEAKQE